MHPVQAQQREAGPAIGPLVVRLNVAGLDKLGNPVSDLKSEELKITDAGKPQQIVYFRRDESERGTTAKGGPNPRATVILFDLLNESMSNRGFGTGEIVRTLQKLETTDYIYIYMLTKDGTLYPVHPVPPLNELGLPVAPWTGKLSGALDAALRAVTQRKTVDMRLTTDFIGASYQALQAVAREMAPIPGRKSLIWISRGVPIYIHQPGREILDLTPQVRAIGAALDRENVALVPVILGQSENIDERLTLETLAALTGGPPNTTDDIAVGVNQSLQTARASYRVVYDPSPKSWDGKFHKIKVTCTRAGVRIQAKDGYTADSSQRMPWGNEQAEQAAIQAAMASPFDFRELGLRATIVTGAFQIRVNLPDVLLLHSGSGDRYQGELVISTARFYLEGQPPKFTTVPVVLDLTEKQRDALLTEGVIVTDKEPLDANMEKVRIVVYDRGSGSIGALNVAVR
jgi:VWFA-related protein